jgi:hypothetical protein
MRRKRSFRYVAEILFLESEERRKGLKESLRFRAATTGTQAVRLVPRRIVRQG